ncbi:hypothetical protein CFAM422_009655 [Trichoderma lentiforme]|uniref:Uncharacterized protein n=1 Tax=Trichoderma lentiforme TaxID=1567552 RepID=A0A9P5CB89_9HYPO|nr:hypothetical protein CFAM422_009655 [Trichoderma lentiforme]
MGTETKPQSSEVGGEARPTALEEVELVRKELFGLRREFDDKSENEDSVDKSEDDESEDKGSVDKSEDEDSVDKSEDDESEDDDCVVKSEVFAGSAASPLSQT